jgi:hypothetical protein
MTVSPSERHPRFGGDILDHSCKEHTSREATGIGLASPTNAAHKPCMTAKAFGLDNLVDVTERLGPNMWVKLDWVAFERCFGAGPDSKAAHEAATTFAQDHHLALFFDDLQRVVEFSRPYFDWGNEG